MNKAQQWIKQEYQNEDLDKWVFTKIDMEEAFKAGQRVGLNVGTKVGDEVLENLCCDLSYKATQRFGW